MFLLDGLQNVLAQLGMGGDKAAHTGYVLSTIDDNQLESAYRNSWIARKLVDLPVDDALRQWRKWNADAETVRRIEKIEEESGLYKKLEQALKSARLFGGAALFIGTNVNALNQPLKLTEELKYLKVLDKKVIRRKNSNLTRALEDDAEQILTIDGVDVHISRLVMLHGAYAPRSTDLFGDSALMSAWDAIRNADGTNANVAALVYEAKIDVFKIPHLMDSLGDPGYEASLMRRLSLANHGKSVTNALLMDTEEEHEQKSANFGGLRELLLSFYQIAAGACDIPMTRLLGASAGGLNSTGDNDVRDYYDKVRAHQENDIRPAMYLLDKLIAANAGAGDEVDYDWCSLWQWSDAEKAEFNSKNAATIATLTGTMLFSDDVMHEIAKQLLGDGMPAIENLGGELDADAI